MRERDLIGNATLEDWALMRSEADIPYELKLDG